MSNKYLVCTPEKISMVDACFGLNLAKIVFCGSHVEGFSIGKHVLENIDEVANLVMETAMSEDEISIVKEVTGFCGEGFLGEELHAKKSLEKKYKINEKILDCIIAGAYRRLRHPTRFRFFRGDYSPYRLIYQRYDDFYYRNLEDTFIHEIGNIVSDEAWYMKNVYLHAITKRYGIVIRSEAYKKTAQDDIDYDTSIEELSLSARTFNALNSSGINTVYDLRNLDEKELLSIRNLGKKAQQEIEETLHDYDVANSPYNTIYFQRNNEVTVFKYFSGDSEKIAKSIYRNILSIQFGEKTLFDPVFSPGFTEFLLIKGYLFLNDVLNDYNELVHSLQVVGLLDYIDELDLYIKYQNYPENDDKVVIMPFDKELEAQFSKHIWETTEELLKYGEENDIDEESSIFKLIKAIQKEFYELE